MIGDAPDACGAAGDDALKQGDERGAARPRGAEAIALDVVGVEHEGEVMAAGKEGGVEAAPREFEHDDVGALVADDGGKAAIEGGGGDLAETAGRAGLDHAGGEIAGVVGVMRRRRCEEKHLVLAGEVGEQADGAASAALVGGRMG